MTTRTSSATTSPTSATTPTTPTTKKRKTRRTKRTRSTRKPRTTKQMTTRTSSATMSPTSATTPTTPTKNTGRTRRTKRTRSTRKPRTTKQMTTRTSSATTSPTSATTPTTPTTKKRRTRRTKRTRKPRRTTPYTSTSRRTTRRTTTKTTPSTPTTQTTTETTPSISTTQTTTETTPSISTTQTTTETTPSSSTSQTTTKTTPSTSTTKRTTTRTTTNTTPKTSTTRRTTTTKRSTTRTTTRKRTTTTKRPNAVVGVLETSGLPLETTRYYKEWCPTNNVKCKCPYSTIQSYDGTCNNLKHSSNGVADTVFKRVLLARYSDGKYEIAKSVVGNTALPSARSISVSVFGTNDDVDSTRTLLNPIYLMFLSQDIQEIAMSKEESDKNIQLCCDPKGRMLAEELLPDNCQPIPISEMDNFFSTFGQTCLNYQRHKTAPECHKSGVASQQVNLRSSYLDLSVLYGSSENENKKLRAFEKGHMKTRLVPSGGRRRHSFLPIVENEEVCGASNKNSHCYLSANPKVNQIFSLAALQTLFVRLHNGIADRLSSINSKWTDDELYHEARKITIALHHHFTYNEALPSLLGKKITDGLELSFKNLSHAYDQDVSAEAMSEFAAVISPVISSLLPSKIRLKNEGRFDQTEVDLLDGKNHNSFLEEQSALDSALRGLTGQPSQSFDRHFAKEFIEREIVLDTKMKMGMDQIAEAIQVGRDLGISSYNDAREYCGMDRAVYFQGFDDVMSDQAIRRLEAVYKSPEDVDLAVGILQENKVDGGMLGPTTSCILGEQFMRLRLADRFFANAAGFNHSFTEAKLNSILATRFSSVVCDVTDQLESMQLDAFQPISKTNPLISCSELPALDLTPWHNAALPQEQCNKIK